MARLIVLGSAAAVSDTEHDNTHFVLQGERSVVLVDCGSNPMVKLRRFGIDHNQVTDMILTHFHPDHVYGVPMLLMHLWLLGRRIPLRVHGLDHCLLRTEDLMSAFSWDDWPQFFPVAFHRVLAEDGYLVLDNEDFRIWSWPVKHYNIPTIGLRIESKKSGKLISYSCDTAPISAVQNLAQDADILIHESTGHDPKGHSSAYEAGQIAAKADCKRLILIHYEVWEHDPTPLIDEARVAYDGPIELATDFNVYDI
ncbi:MAG: MBL fold metallo-hydrolase [Phototrophicales bacterium]|nr:MAG: MBL fold metallo-hydrolase [Phototrophicales bacterium]